MGNFTSALNNDGNLDFNDEPIITTDHPDSSWNDCISTVDKSNWIVYENTIILPDEVKCGIRFDGCNNITVKGNNNTAILGRGLYEPCITIVDSSMTLQDITIQANNQDAIHTTNSQLLLKHMNIFGEGDAPFDMNAIILYGDQSHLVVEDNFFSGVWNKAIATELNCSYFPGELPMDLPHDVKHLELYELFDCNYVPTPTTDSPDSTTEDDVTTDDVTTDDVTTDDVTTDDVTTDDVTTDDVTTDDVTTDDDTTDDVYPINQKKVLKGQVEGDATDDGGSSWFKWLKWW